MLDLAALANVEPSLFTDDFHLSELNATISHILYTMTDGRHLQLLG